jgi:hypothetical protein
VPFPYQEHGGPSLTQRVRDLYLQMVGEYTSRGFTQEQFVGEFLNHVQEQITEHNRPDEEWIAIAEDIQEALTGTRPQHR